ncbi:MAG: trypsin-like peptidase domain-containing protein [Phycisphaerales bacterium]
MHRIATCVLGLLTATSAIASPGLPATGTAEGIEAGESIRADARESVVKIFATYRGPQFQSPWSKSAPDEYTGTGFVIEGNRILTNAHVVEQSSQIFIQPPGSADRLRANLVAISRGIDLAVLELRRESERVAFHASHPPLELKPELPKIGGTVQAFGYPLGGEQISITEGVVSRIEYADYYQQVYGLRVQVDAALNPGNSGGPVLMGDQVIGVTFSGMDQAENIGYLIPAEEVRAFLDDVEDGEYDGHPTLMAERWQTAENEALRDWLGLKPEHTGPIYVDDKEDLPLELWDLVDSIAGTDIDNDGLVTIEDGVRVSWAYLIPRSITDGTIDVTVVRKGERMDLKLPVTNNRNRLISYLGNDYPEYFVLGPLVFSPISLDHLEEYYPPYLTITKSPLISRIDDSPKFEGEELVVVASPFLPHPIAKGYEIAYRPTVKAINDTPIRSLEHMLSVIRDLDDDFIVFSFHDTAQETLVFDREELLEATEEILEDNSIRRQGSKRFMDIWED